MKIQYPGVADSIESDIENVKRLLTYTNLLPEQMYIDNAMKVQFLITDLSGTFPMSLGLIRFPCYIMIWFDESHYIDI